MTPAAASVDTLIIGSGVAATAVSERLLTKDPSASVMLLEAGSPVVTKDFALWQNYLITNSLPYEQFRDLKYPQRDSPGENSSIGGTEMPLDGARVFTYGGSTIHWGGWSFRLKPEDFRLRTKCRVGADWPISYADLEPYYGQAEEFIGVSGDGSDDAALSRSCAFPFAAFPYTLEDRPLISAFEALKMSYGHVPIARRGISDTTQRRAPCQTTGTCKYCPFGARFTATDRLNELHDWHDYPNFEVRTGAVVERLEMASKGRAAGVFINTRSGTEPEHIEAARIVVAAGTLESAKLLLRSVSTDWPAGVGNNHDLVGRHLATHPYFVIEGSIATNPLNLQAENGFPTLCTRHFDSPAEQASGKFILVNPNESPRPSLAKQMQSGMTRTQIDSALSGTTLVEVHGMVEVFGRATNKVDNSSRRNRLGMLETRVDYTKDAGFDTRMAQIRAHVERIFRAMNVDPTGNMSISWRADHAACTCRMGVDPADSVVDANLAVHDVDNVFVCSNATFPSIGAINPTLTLTALALRLGDHLAQSTRSGPR
jgi:choline dehydrogenase-like flavoprotein